MPKELTKIEFLGREFKNPVVAASGTYGYGEDYKRYYDPFVLGGLCTKGVTLEPRPGNSGIRLWETPMGLLNSIGLENPGLDVFIEEILPKIEYLNNKTNVIVNVAGHDEEGYAEVLERLEKFPQFLIELNLSCPNVSSGMIYGRDPNAAYNLLKDLKKYFHNNVMVKLTPNCSDIVEVAKACEEAGAPAVSLINTIQGMAIDYKTKKIVFNNTFAGLSGPAIKPIALRMVYQVAKAVNIPVVGMGGITSYKDVLEFLMAGASLVQVGTMNFVNPHALSDIIRDLEHYCLETGEKLRNLVNIL